MVQVVDMLGCLFPCHMQIALPHIELYTVILLHIEIFHGCLPSKPLKQGHTLTSTAKLHWALESDKS